MLTEVISKHVDGSFKRHIRQKYSFVDVNRRKFLLGSSVALSTALAGCASDGTEEVEGGTRDENGGENGSGNGDTESSESADVEILDSELVIEPGSWSTDVYVEATVENSGEVPSGDIELQADWYDEDGNYLDNDNARLTSLKDGETWLARIYFLGTDAEDVDDYELEGEFDEDDYEPTEGLSLADSNMEVQADELTVEGEVENNTGEEQSYVEVVATIYDDDGNVLGDQWTNVTDLRDGETWAFDFDYSSRDVRDRAQDAADHEILVKDSAW
ncbi:FxLYD domain-containing protein [Natrialba hulunbeirensis]|uniref:FxLYD domain-containing protein n=1 Tax=Natrialba hulunbeirensis TaxID=123783 RepID=UPI001F4C770E|nr:FxLYD domain-containing protein [Natrialba hulunbeirensis]